MFPHIPLPWVQCTAEETLIRSQQHLDVMRYRRSVRFFSDKPVPDETINQLITLAGLAPSGANKQPWTFCIVKDPALKREIRRAAEEEERISYETRMSPEWLEDLAPLGTDWNKPFLEIAPFLIIVFRQAWEPGKDGKRRNTYYSIESTGIACGMLITAIHLSGLVTLTHTPSPMNFLSKILGRPENERPFLLLPVGFPAVDATVPDLPKKPLSEIAVWY